MELKTPVAAAAYRTDAAEPFEFVPIRPEGTTPDPAVQRLVTIDTVHDGDRIPADLLDSPAAERLASCGALWDAYVLERDWGANLIAYHVARELGLAGYHRVNLARVVMDYNRLPGSTPPGVRYFDRLAISDPFAACLDHPQKMDVLEHYYDVISDKMEQAIGDKLLKVSIHTYDVQNASQTERPEVSILTRSESYQRDSALPYGVFDPLFPDRLAESCANRVLRDRLALTLQKAGLRVEHNYPYCLPDGSIEVRCQPWFFFNFLRKQFEKRFPESVGSEAYTRVWRMLLNTNLRRVDSEMLRGYLHRYRRVPEDQTQAFSASASAYVTIRTFLREQPELIEAYRASPARPSTLGIEVRKDLVWRFEDGNPVAPREGRARFIAQLIAEAVYRYLSEDSGVAASAVEEA